MIFVRLRQECFLLCQIDLSVKTQSKVFYPCFKIIGGKPSVNKNFFKQPPSRVFNPYLRCCRVFALSVIYLPLIKRSQHLLSIARLANSQTNHNKNYMHIFMHMDSQSNDKNQSLYQTNVPAPGLSHQIIKSVIIIIPNYNDPWYGHQIIKSVYVFFFISN